MSEPDLIVTRLFAAPPHAVFHAWTDPAQVSRWWGPHGFTLPFCSIDLRPGGAWHYCMRSPEGQDYWCKGVYREITAPERIVSTDFFSDAQGNLVQPAQYGMSPDWPAEMVVTATFAAEDGKTRLTIRQSVPQSLAESCGAVDGWNQSLDRLGQHLARP